MMRIRLAAGSLSILTLAPFLLGVGNAPPLRDVRFAVTGVTVAGPATIPNGSSANYTVTANIQRDGIAQNATIDRVRISVYSGNTQLAVLDTSIPPNANTISASMPLSCTNNEVRGGKAGSGHGGRGQFLWWSWDDPAEVKGHMNEKESEPIRILCRPG